MLTAYTQATTHSSLEIADQQEHMPWWISDNFSRPNLKCCKILCDFFLVGLFSLWFIFSRNEWILALTQTTFQNVPRTGQWSSSVWTFPSKISWACTSVSAGPEALGPRSLEATRRTSHDGLAWGLRGLWSHIQGFRTGFHKTERCRALCWQSRGHFTSHYHQPLIHPQTGHWRYKAATLVNKLTCQCHFTPC